MLAERLFASHLSFAVLLVEFLLATLLVLVLSIKLTACADRIEKHTRLSEMWIGMLLLAFVTSLPEAVNAIGATFIGGAMNLGIGNLTGSNMFNMIIIVILDLAQGHGPLLLQVKENQVFIAAGGILLMALAGIAIALYVPYEGLALPGRHAGIVISLVMAIAFLVITWLLAHRASADSREDRASHDQKDLSRDAARSAIIRFVAYALAVVVASIWMLRTCDALARQPLALGGRQFVLGHTFVGAFMVALGTSLPEVFVSLGALKLGRVNMSVANIFGSNIMNMGFFPLMHLFVFRASFYQDVSPANLVMLFAAVIMSTLFIVGLLINSSRSFLFLGWEAVMILITYAGAAYLVFRLGVG